MIGKCLTNLGLVGAVPPPVAFITSTLKLESTVNAAASPVAIIILLVPLKLNLSKSYVFVVPWLVASDVQDPLVPPYTTVPPLAATILSLNIADICTLSVLEATWGTIVELYFVVPFNLLYPPSVDGSKFTNCNASPGAIS